MNRTLELRTDQLAVAQLGILVRTLIVQGEDITAWHTSETERVAADLDAPNIAGFQVA